MLVIPAIDLLEGKAVRLAEGDRQQATIYSDTPWELAAEFARTGAKRLHIVDLDGAFAGKPAQVELIRRLLDAAREAAGDSVEIEVGGGIRDAAAVETLIDAGVNKVVVGTLAIREPELVEQLCARHPDAIVVAIDARDGMVSIEGWQETSSVPASDLARRAAGWGAAATGCRSAPPWLRRPRCRPPSTRSNPSTSSPAVASAPSNTSTRSSPRGSAPSSAAGPSTSAALP